jgi:hypothetical protein
MVYLPWPKHSTRRLYRIPKSCAVRSPLILPTVPVRYPFGMLRRIDPLKGTGIVTSTRGKTPVEYELEIWQEQIPTPMMDNPKASVPGMLQFRGGWIRPVCCPLGEIASLEMQDGRSLKFAYTFLSSGTIRVYG